MCYIFYPSCPHFLVKMGGELDAVCQADKFNVNIYSLLQLEKMEGWITAISISSALNCCSGNTKKGLLFVQPPMKKIDFVTNYR